MQHFCNTKEYQSKCMWGEEKGDVERVKRQVTVKEKIDTV